MELEEAAALEERFFAEYAAAHFPPGLGFTLGRDFRISPDVEHWERFGEGARRAAVYSARCEADASCEPRGAGPGLHQSDAPLAEYADAIAADPNLAGVGSSR